MSFRTSFETSSASTIDKPFELDVIDGPFPPQQNTKFYFCAVIYNNALQISQAVTVPKGATIALGSLMEDSNITNVFFTDNDHVEGIVPEDLQILAPGRVGRYAWATFTIPEDATYSSGAGNAVMHVVASTS